MPAIWACFRLPSQWSKSVRFIEPREAACAWRCMCHYVATPITHATTQARLIAARVPAAHITRMRACLVTFKLDVFLPRTASNINFDACMRLLQRLTEAVTRILLSITGTSGWSQPCADLEAGRLP